MISFEYKRSWFDYKKEKLNFCHSLRIGIEQKVIIIHNQIQHQYRLIAINIINNNMQSNQEQILQSKQQQKQQRQLEKQDQYKQQQQLNQNDTLENQKLNSKDQNEKLNMGTILQDQSYALEQSAHQDKGQIKQKVKEQLPQQSQRLQQELQQHKPQKKSHYQNKSNYQQNNIQIENQFINQFDIQMNNNQNQYLSRQHSFHEKPRKKLSVKNDGNWQEYIQKVFNYYCKRSYSTGKNTTFDRIQQKTQFMDVAAFFAFARDFQIDFGRLKLMDIFKKSTDFGSLMNLSQFVDSINILKQQFSNHKKKLQKSKHQQIDNQTAEKMVKKGTISFNQFLQHLRMHNAGAFHNKMIQIGRKSRIRGVNPHQNQIKIKPVSQYKFKLNSLNGRNANQLKQQIDERKSNKKIAQELTKKIKQIKAEVKAKKFVQFNKIPIREKIILKGGYMKPQVFDSNKKVINFVQSNYKMKSSKIYKQFSVPVNSSQLESINTSIVYQDRKRNKTQFNSYINSLEQSINFDEYKNEYRTKSKSPQKINSCEKSLEESKKDRKSNLNERQTRGQQKNNKFNGYLKNYRMRENNQYGKKETKYSINNIIKLAKQSNQPLAQKKGVQSKDIYKGHSRLSNNQSFLGSSGSKQHSNSYSLQKSRIRVENRKKTQGLQTGYNAHQQLYSLRQEFLQKDQYLQNFIKGKNSKQKLIIPNELKGVLDDEQDEDSYLQKIKKFNKINNQNKKRLIQYHY